MGCRNEQYDYNGGRSSWRRWRAFLKKSTARLARRLGRRFLEDAPPRRVGGWVS